MELQAALENDFLRMNEDPHSNDHSHHSDKSVQVAAKTDSKETSEHHSIAMPSNGLQGRQLEVYQLIIKHVEEAKKHRIKKCKDIINQIIAFQSKMTAPANENGKFVFENDMLALIDLFVRLAEETLCHQFLQVMVRSLLEKYRIEIDHDDDIEACIEIFNFENYQAKNFKATEDLIKELHHGFKSLFSALSTEKFIQLATIAKSNSFVLKTIRYSEGIRKHAEPYINEGLDPEAIIKTSSYIFMVFGLVQKSLYEIIEEKGFNFYGLNEVDTTIEPDVILLEIYSKYFRSAVGDKITDRRIAPFFQQFSIELCNALTAFKEQTVVQKASKPSQHRNKRVQVLSVRMPETEWTLEWRKHKVETRAVLYRRAPYVAAVLSGAAFIEAGKQLISVFDDVDLKNGHEHSNLRTILLSSVVSGGLVAAIAGFLSGRSNILNPHLPSSRAFRIIEATSNGLVVLVFSMGFAITLYTSFREDISLLTFGLLSIVPLITCVASSIVQAIPVEIMARNVKLGTCRKLYIVNKSAFYSGVFQLGLTDFVSWLGLDFNELANRLIFQFTPLLLAVPVALLEHCSSFRERIYSGMVALMTLDFTGQTLYDMRRGSRDNFDLPDPLTYAKGGLLIVGGCYTVYFLARHSLQFIEYYRGEPIIVTQSLVAPAVPAGQVKLELKALPGVDETAFSNAVRAFKPQPGHSKIPRNAQAIEAEQFVLTAFETSKKKGKNFKRDDLEKPLIEFDAAIGRSDDNKAVESPSHRNPIHNLSLRSTNSRSRFRNCTIQ